jgi:membrane protease YdiL (CAAX protease family)
MMNFHWDPLYFKPVFAVTSFIMLSLIHHYNIVSLFISALVTNLFPGEIRDKVRVFIEKTAGFILFGVIPFFAVLLVLKDAPSEYGCSLVTKPLYYLFACVLCALLFPILLLFSKTQAAKRSTPLGSPEGWSAGLVILHCLFHVLYLTGYEFFIRGYLLFTLARFMNTWPAIFIVTALYTSIHIGKEKGETIGAFFMGIVFALFALVSGSVLIPLMVHSFIAVLVDVLVFRRQKRESSGNADG